MIRYLKHNEIDFKRWDLCIEQSVNPLVYATSWYLDKACSNWEGLVLNDYEAVMPLTANRKHFIYYLYQPFFTQQLGVFSKVEITQDLLLDFINSIPQKFRFIDIQLNEFNQILSPKFKTTKRKNYVLNLQKSYEKIQKNFDQHTKRNLKKAKKHHLEMRSISYADVLHFYLLHKAQLTKGVKQQHYDMLLHLMEEADQRKYLFAKGVFNHANELIAAGVFIHFRNRIIFLLGTASDTGREFGAMYFMFDNLILQYAHHSLVLDFEGSEIPGIARFFKGFGSEKTHYYKLKINKLPFFIRLIKP